MCESDVLKHLTGMVDFSIYLHNTVQCLPTTYYTGVLNLGTYIEWFLLYFYMTNIME